MEIFHEKHKEIFIKIDQKMPDRIDKLEIDMLCKIRVKQLWITEDSRSEKLKSDLYGIKKRIL